MRSDSSAKPYVCRINSRPFAAIARKRKMLSPEIAQRPNIAPMAESETVQIADRSVSEPFTARRHLWVRVRRPLWVGVEQEAIVRVRVVVQQSLHLLFFGEDLIHPSDGALGIDRMYGTCDTS